MALIEVEDSEFQSSSAAKQLLDKFANNPKLRPKLLGLIKELNPDAPIPEIDATSSIRSELDALRSELGGTVGELKTLLDTNTRRREIEDTIVAERRKLRKAGWDDEGIANIETLMEKRGLVDYEAAAALVEKQMVKPAPMESADILDHGWNISLPDQGDVSHELLLKNPIAFQRAEIKKFLAEKRASRG
jgi:hypothetical protein